jgi:hypothetical protein
MLTFWAWCGVACGATSRSKRSAALSRRGVQRHDLTAPKYDHLRRHLVRMLQSSLATERCHGSFLLLHLNVLSILRFSVCSWRLSAHQPFVANMTRGSSVFRAILTHVVSPHNLGGVLAAVRVGTRARPTRQTRSRTRIHTDSRWLGLYFFVDPPTLFPCLLETPDGSRCGFSLRTFHI